MRIDLDKTQQEDFDWLRSQGYTGAYNDMMFDYLVDQNLVGALSDMLFAWRIITADITAPNPTDFTVSAQQPNGSFDIGIAVDADPSLPFAAYIVAVPNAEGTPTAAQIKLGQNAASGAAPISASYSFSTTTTSEVVSVSAPGLSGLYKWGLAIEDAAGNLSATVLTVSGIDVNTTPPTVVSAVIDGAAMVITFSEALNAANDTSPSDWVIDVNGSPVTVSAAAIDGVDATKVNIALAAPVISTDTVLRTYSGTTLRDAVSNQVAAFTDNAVTNNTAATTFVDTMDYVASTELSSLADYEAAGLVIRSFLADGAGNAGMGTNANGTMVMRYVGGTLPSDHFAEVTLTDVTGISFSSRIGVSVRHTDSSNYYRAAAVGSTQIEVVRTATAGNSTLVTQTVAALVADDRIRLVIVGTSLELFVNDVSVWTGTDTALSSGQSGIFAQVGSSGAARKVSRFEAGAA